MLGKKMLLSFCTLSLFIFHFKLLKYSTDPDGTTKRKSKLKYVHASEDILDITYKKMNTNCIYFK